MNSSLFYFGLEFMAMETYEYGYIRKFPIPEEKKMLKYSILLNKMKERFMNKLFSVFEKERNRFITSNIKIRNRPFGLNFGKIFFIILIIMRLFIF